MPSALAAEVDNGSLFIADPVLPCHLHGVNCALILVLRGRTSWVSTDMDRSHRHLTAQLTDFWLARGAILVIVMLQIGIVNDLAVGPRWLAPGLELALLIPVSLATAWMQQRARGASTDAQWASIGRHRRMVRRLAGFCFDGSLHIDEFRCARPLNRCDLGWSCGQR